MAEQDLTPRICQYLDRHLSLILLEFVQSKKIYPANETSESQLKLLLKTNMIDSAADVYKALGQSVPEELQAKRESVVAQLKSLNQQVQTLLQFLAQAELVKNLRAEKQFTAQYLADNFNISSDEIEKLYDYAKLQFDCGTYPEAAANLHFYRLLTQNAERSFSALWGKLACEIATGNWENANEDLFKLKDAIEAKVFSSPITQLQQRLWLLHWSLFVFFAHPNGRNGIIDLFFQDKYLNAIQTSAPHILRYLTVAIITNKRRRNVLKRLVDLIQQERYSYHDSVTEFVECLHVHFDFEAAQRKLQECESILTNDFFLAKYLEEFKDNARLFIFETYCRIHQCIDITMLAEKLGMPPVEAERWIVNLIRNARLDAKIDSKSNQVIMGRQYPTVYTQVIEKTKGLSFRSLVLANASTAPAAAATGARHHHHHQQHQHQQQQPSQPQTAVAASQ